MRLNTLRRAIVDAMQRMASNRDPAYRAIQQAKVDEWLEEMTRMYEADPLIFTSQPMPEDI